MPVQISQLSARKSTTQLSGSIMACARYGTSYSAVIVLDAVLSAACGSPVFFATAPGFWDVSEKSRSICSVESPELGPRSQCTISLSRPSFAGQNPSAITATPEGTCSTAFTPGTFSDCVASKSSAFPPNTGDRATTAVNIPGR